MVASRTQHYPYNQISGCSRRRARSVRSTCANLGKPSSGSQYSSFNLDFQQSLKHKGEIAARCTGDQVVERYQELRIRKFPNEGNLSTGVDTTLTRARWFLSVLSVNPDNIRLVSPIHVVLADVISTNNLLANRLLKCQTTSTPKRASQSLAPCVRNSPNHVVVSNDPSTDHLSVIHEQQSSTCIVRERRFKLFVDRSCRERGVAKRTLLVILRRGSERFWRRSKR